MPGRHITDSQRGLFMRTRQTDSTEVAAAKAGFSPASGYRIARDPTPPPDRRQSRGRRRADPLAEVFETEVVPLLEQSPGLRPVGVFRELMRRCPQLGPGVRRTLERRIRVWRAEHGPEKEVIFRQTQEAGHLGVSDFTDLKGLGVLVAGAPLDLRLYHFRLPWSGFAHARVVSRRGELLRAVRGVAERARETRGGAAREPHGQPVGGLPQSLEGGRRGSDRTLSGGVPALRDDAYPQQSRGGHENGAIESPHGHLKRELADALALRGSKDFGDLDAYRAFVSRVIAAANARRAGRIEAERRVLRPLPPRRATDDDETSVRVTSLRRLRPAKGLLHRAVPADRPPPRGARL